MWDRLTIPWAKRRLGTTVYWHTFNWNARRCCHIIRTLFMLRYVNIYQCLIHYDPYHTFFHMKGIREIDSYCWVNAIHIEPSHFRTNTIDKCNQNPIFPYGITFTPSTILYSLSSLLICRAFVRSSDKCLAHTEYFYRSIIGLWHHKASLYIQFHE